MRTTRVRSVGSSGALGWNRTSGTRFRKPIRILCLTGKNAENPVRTLAFGFMSTPNTTPRFSLSRAINARWKRPHIRHQRPRSVFLHEPVELGRQKQGLRRKPIQASRLYENGEDHFRLLCVLERHGTDVGLGGPAVIVIAGMAIPFRTEFKASEYCGVWRLGEEYRKRAPRSVA